MKQTIHPLVLLVLLPLAFNACSRHDPSSPHPDTIASSIAERVAADFKTVRAEAERLAAFTAELYNNQSSLVSNVDRTKYAFAPNGAFYKTMNDGGAALWISGAVPITEDVKNVAYLTEPMDTELARICREHPVVVQAYYNDKNSLNRIYPWMDTLTQYEPKMDIPSFNFYYLADASHNPNRNGVWVADPYVDPAGRGWMISAIAPVYHQESLVGVAGLDVTIDKILENYIDKAPLPLAVISADGILVAATEQVISLLEMPPLKEHKYLQTVKQDTFKPDDYNIKHSTLRPVRVISDALGRSTTSPLQTTLLKSEYLIYTTPIAELGWTVAVFTPAKK